MSVAVRVHEVGGAGRAADQREHLPAGADRLHNLPVMRDAHRLPRSHRGVIDGVAEVRHLAADRDVEPRRQRGRLGQRVCWAT